MDLTKHSIATLLVTFLLLSNSVYGGLILNEGQSYNFEFSSISLYAFDPDDLFGDPPISISNQYAHTEFHLGSNYLSTGESLIFSAFGNSASEPAIRSGIFNGFAGNTGGGFFLGEIPLKPWQDKQGVIRIEVVIGTIELESFTIATVIGDQFYKQTYSVPEPNSVVLLFTGMGVLRLRRKARKRGQKNETG